MSSSGNVYNEKGISIADEEQTLELDDTKLTAEAICYINSTQTGKKLFI